MDSKTARSSLDPDTPLRNRSMKRERELPSAGGLASIDGKDMSGDE